MSTKGIILAGGYGTRLYPCTAVISKHLLPIYDKPMIFYSLSILMLSGIKDILIITSSEHLSLYKKTLSNFNKIGLNIKFAIQKKPNGIAAALIIGKNFINKSNFVLILGDNLFFGQGLGATFLKLLEFKKAAGIVTYEVENPSQFGVLELDNKGTPLRILEKPKKTRSKLAVTGIYFYQNKVLNFINKLKPSKRGELEITSVNNIFLKRKDLVYEKLGRGFSWLDSGTCSNLLEASQFVETIEKRQGHKIACLEEIALRKNFISKLQFKKIIKNYPKTDYKKYLQGLLLNETL
jgi:glucose-1-phosphate thymidylyltransferase